MIERFKQELMEEKMYRFDIIEGDQLHVNVKVTEKKHAFLYIYIYISFIFISEYIFKTSKNLKFNYFTILSQVIALCDELILSR